MDYTSQLKIVSHEKKRREKERERERETCTEGKRGKKIIGKYPLLKFELTKLCNWNKDINLSFAIKI